MQRLVEYQATRLRLSEPDLDMVLGLSKSAHGEAGVIESVTPTSAVGVFDVRPGPFVGRLGLPSGETLDIDSRFGFDGVLELLQVAGRLPTIDRPETAEVGAGRLLIDLLALTLAREIESLASAGLAKDYERRRFHRPPYPGVIDVAEHLGRHAGRQDRLVTVARRLTLDIGCNRALAHAVEVLGRLPLATGARRQLQRLRPLFGPVRPEPMSADAIRRLPLTKLTRRYRPALALAALVVEGQELAPVSGGVSGGSVLFNMAKVWEACVARWVRNWSDESCDVVQEHPFHLDRQRRLRASADVAVLREGRVVAVYDAKYKPFGSLPSRGDIYQMLAYCQRLGLRQATLVHPVGDGGAVEIGDVTVEWVGMWPSASSTAGWGSLATWRPPALAVLAPPTPVGL